ncbi:bifunctional folylpolyglutamate synthase/dihydrofolate synthase [Liquorilactobacillus uvarum]|uniref:tetrahydrofolate synthase n=1 Tax=Liquorilactobacillus uvarum DSM 19971 TaxID=1423812 RepID=A0A0R1Q4T3_9LACO|nr:Mur ligase family protein [Liquorilactobacillus uvarum]KRL37202.1 bifunctional folylpolyglutamate synthase dihydrofolate synthase [Liquorilactobacillus uvarum DSM 19971]
MTNNQETDLPRFLYGQGDRITIIKHVLQQLGQPDKNFTIIHVCGTNGKGSTSSMIAALLQNMNYKTGLFTSPFVRNITESIQINNKMIPANELMKYTKLIESTLEEMGLSRTELSSFEMIFTAAMLYFSDNKVKYVVLECGLGGELDATNAVSQTAYSIFTKIGLDHIKILGETISEIAATKSKIIREKADVIVAPNQREQAFNIIKKEAQKKKAHVYFADEKNLTVSKTDNFSQIMCLKTNNKKFKFKFSLFGTYQKENLATVLMWLNVFLSKEAKNIDWHKLIQKTMSNMSIPGRFEKISMEPLVILDAAHNLDGIKAFVKTVNSLYPTAKKNVIVGFLKDKDYKHCLTELVKLKNARFILTEPDNIERRLTAAELQKSFYTVSGKNLPAFNDPKEALAYTLKMNSEKCALTLVVGSFYLLKVIRNCFVDKKEEAGT